MPASKVSNPIFARIFPRLSRAMEAGGIADWRKTLLGGLTGQVIDIGAGTGPSFGHYPVSVTRGLAVEPEPRLRRFAAAAARAAPVPVEVTDGLASALPAGDGSFDAAVVSFVLCTVPDRARRWARSAGCCDPAASCSSSSMSAPTQPGSPGPSACWTPPCGRTCSAAATSAATPPPRSSGPGSPSRGLTGSCSQAPGPRSRFTSLARPPQVAAR